MQPQTIKARREYAAADEKGKAMLVSIFGILTLTEKITGVVKTFEDACAVTGANPNDAEFTTGKAHRIALAKLEVISEALNEGWQPNWDNTREYKYYPWFNMGSSGAGFSFAGCDGGFGRSTVGSRLCFKSSELATYAAKQFVDLYKQYMTI